MLCLRSVLKPAPCYFPASMDVNMYAVYAIFHPYVHTFFACNANVLVGVVGVVGVAKNTKTGTDPYS